MKKQILLTILLGVSSVSLYAQNTLPSIGNVGIGISSPLHSLHVKKTLSQNGNIKLEDGIILMGDVIDDNLTQSYPEYKRKIISDGGIKMNSDGPYFSMATKNNGKSLVMAIAAGDKHFSNISKKDDVVFRVYSSNSLIFANENGAENNNFKFTTRSSTEQSASTKLIIKNNGNIGIGTETPDSKLAVNGDIHAKEVRIDLAGWADYVFYDTYKLPTIEEAKQHIESKGHLINMPSAKQILSDGLNVGEITRLQQEKIEELMLYIIQMDKEIKDLKDELQSKKQ